MNRRGSIQPDHRRGSGVLLHVTSLPGAYDIGDLGPAAHRFVEMLAGAKQRYWQILPLGPSCGGGTAPYQCFSAFAGNPMLISPETLEQERLIDLREVNSARLPAGRVEFAAVERAKTQLLLAAWERFQERRPRRLMREMDAFRQRAQPWLGDHALYMALSARQGTYDWTRWPGELKRRDRAALRSARRALAEHVEREVFFQFLFTRQLEALRKHAAGLGVRLIGDMPIFVSLQSADVWAEPGLFQLRRDGTPKAVAGVPPDLFSRDGQHWGNPLYDWAAMARDKFEWWTRRLRWALSQTDLVRIDHFRGFESYWRIPAGSPNARFGRWVKAPGEALFQAIQKSLGESLPVIAEDLGLITPEVEALRDRFGFPGMHVLQFAFGGDARNPHLPHNHRDNAIAYTGTHDNDTSAGWYGSAGRKVRAHLQRYAPGEEEVCWKLIRLAWSSVARIAIAPVQDLLGLESTCRMNIPGTCEGNWQWRLGSFAELRRPLARLKALTEIYGRTG